MQSGRRVITATDELFFYIRCIKKLFHCSNLSNGRCNLHCLFSIQPSHQQQWPQPTYSLSYRTAEGTRNGETVFPNRASSCSAAPLATMPGTRSSANQCDAFLRGGNHSRHVMPATAAKAAASFILHHSKVFFIWGTVDSAYKKIGYRNTPLIIFFSVPGFLQILRSGNSA